MPIEPVTEETVTVERVTVERVTVERVTVERVTVDDWREVRTLRLRALTEDPGAFGFALDVAEAQTDAEWKVWVAGHDGTAAHMPLARVAGDLVGMASGSVNSRSGEAQLFAMWVAPEHRRSGIATALVGEVVGWAERSGHDSIMLWVVGDNAAAIRLYERCGFGATDEPVDDEHCGMSATLMRRPISYGMS